MKPKIDNLSLSRVISTDEEEKSLLLLVTHLDASSTTLQFSKLLNISGETYPKMVSISLDNLSTKEVIEFLQRVDVLPS